MEHEEQLEKVPCSGCGKEFTSDDLKTVAGNDLCLSCFEQEFTECYECSTIISNSDSNRVSRRGEEVSVCESCYASRYRECSSCERFFHRRYESWRILANGERICEDCWQNGDYGTCEGCDNYFHYDDLNDGYCSDCADSRKSHLINEYGTDPMDSLTFQGKPKDGLYAGVELEVNCYSNMNENAQETLDLLGEDFVILKEDSSICGGFEIVTAPATPEIHRKKWEAFLSHPPSGINAERSGHCGMHVHISRKPISPLTLGKLLLFINREENQEFITHIAGRFCEEYAKYVSNVKRNTGSTVDQAYGDVYDPVTKNYIWGPVGKKQAVPSCRSDRYTALNFANFDTIEFRMFNSTLKKPIFFKNLEFCYAAIHFAAQAGPSALSEKDFIAWFKTQGRNTYPALRAWLIEKQYIKINPKKGVSAAACA